MSIITYQELKTNISVLQEVHELKIEQNINDHATLYVTGIMKKELVKSFVSNMLEGEDIEVFLMQEKKKLLFKGLIKEACVYMEGDVYTLELKGISYSVLTDLEKKCISFQDKEIKYYEIFKKIIKQYEDGVVLDNETNDKSIDQLLVQYEETDWEFIRRLASHFHMGIIPNITLKGPKIAIGVNGIDRGVIEAFEYSVKKDIITYQKLNVTEKENLYETDIMTYTVDLMDNFEIGDQVNYVDRVLLIKGKKVELLKGELHFQYELCPQNGLRYDYIPNHNIVGNSIKGIVVDVIRDKVKVLLEIDKEQTDTQNWEFPYSTSYTAEGSGGWYCMPEKGDTVLIYFPTKDEKKAVAISSFRTGENSTDNIDDPTIKYFRTASGKELKFSEDEILITCIQGKDKKTGENKVVQIRLNKDSGVEILSSEPIQFISDKGIKLEAEDKIEFIAKDCINLHCKQSQIKMDQKIDICGPEVRIN